MTEQTQITVQQNQTIPYGKDQTPIEEVQQKLESHYSHLGLRQRFQNWRRRYPIITGLLVAGIAVLAIVLTPLIAPILPLIVI